VLDEIERENAVGDAEDREQQDGDQKPGMVLIDKDVFFLIAFPAGGFAAAAEWRESTGSD
jgi:hypothetical protein